MRTETGKPPYGPARSFNAGFNRCARRQLTLSGLAKISGLVAEKFAVATRARHCDVPAKQLFSEVRPTGQRHIEGGGRNAALPASLSSSTDRRPRLVAARSVDATPVLVAVSSRATSAQSSSRTARSTAAVSASGMMESPKESTARISASALRAPSPMLKTPKFRQVRGIPDHRMEFRTIESRQLCNAANRRFATGRHRTSRSQNPIRGVGSDCPRNKYVFFR